MMPTFYEGINNNNFLNNTVSQNYEGIVITENSNNNNLIGNSIISNSYSGVEIIGSPSNIINNIALNNLYGFFIYGSGNILSGNSAVGHIQGIRLYGGNNTLTNNTMTDNRYNFGVQGFYWDGRDYNNNIDTSNTVDGKPIYYVMNASHHVYDSSTNAGVFYCIYCDDVTIKDLTLTKNTLGIVLINTQNSKIINNTGTGNGAGIYAFRSNGNTFADNLVSNNSLGINLGNYSNNNTLMNNTISNNKYGLTPGYGNMIYNNNFITNSRQVWDYSVNNIFNLPPPIGGNYWSNWTTPDNNGDGFVDNPFVFMGGQDKLPWAKPNGWRSADSIAPITTIQLAGTIGKNNWYISDITVTLSATDNEGGTGVAKIEYSFNGTDWLIYNTPFVINTEGTTSIYYKSTDIAGNTETVNIQEIKIDKTPPIVSIIAPLPTKYEHSDVININFVANDDLSGVYRNAVYLDGLLYDAVNPVDLLYQPLGIHTIKVESENYTGVVATSSVEFEVIADSYSLIFLISRLYQMGEIDNIGIMTSLIQKMEDAHAKTEAGQAEVAQNILRAFIKELDAQSSKHVSVFAVDVLKTDALYLIEHL